MQQAARAQVRAAAIGILVGVVGYTFSAPSEAADSAQTAGSNNPANSPPVSSEAETATLEQIVITGSRVIVNGNNSPTPVTVVSTETLQDIHPTTIIDALNDLPVFIGSRSQQSNPVGSGIAGAGNPAANELSLRNLGPLRTLVLFDGQRVAPSTITNIVDADIIPEMLIQRVDVVTGGVSAVYGSDAVVGVVNFIPDHDFNGLKLEAQGSESNYGDNQSWKAGVAVGTRLFDGRGHIEASYQHYRDAGILDRWSRSWNQKWAVEGTGTAASPYVLASNVRNNSATFGGLITSGALKGNEFLTNGVLTPFVHGTPTNTSTAEIGGDGYYQDASMVAPERYDQFYVRGDYDFTDDIRGHVQASADLKWDSQPDGWPSNANMMFSASNPFLPAAYQAQLATAKQATFNMSEVTNEEPELTPRITTDQYIFNVGLDGTLGKYRWGLALNWGQTTLDNTFLYNQNDQNFAAALDAVVNPANGQIVCNVTLTNPGVDPGCVPLNLFGPTAANAAALNYVFETTHFIAHTGQYDVNGNIAADPFSTWAGPFSVALSGEWRRLTYDSSTDAPAIALADCTGLRFNCNGNTVLWQNAFGNRSKVGVNVWETALEFDAPLVKDMPLVEAFNLNGAVRYMNYSTKGAYVAWKAGIDWHVDEQFRIRGTASRDIRAPNLNELYAPATLSPDSAQDLLTGTSPVIVSYRAGNPNLAAEIGNTRTIGFVYQPSWLPRFSMSVDAYRIVIDNAVVEVKGDSAAIQQSCYASGGSSPYCTLQSRPLGYTNTSPANAVTEWFQYNLNISSADTYGADFEVNYAGQVFGRRYSLRGFATWQPHSIYTQPATDTIDMGGTAYGPTPLIADPSLRVTGTESLEATDKFRIDLVERYRNALRLSGDSALHVACCTVAPVAYTDINLTYKVSKAFGQSQVFFNIQNVFNQNPPPSAPPGNTTPGAMGGWAIGDDPIGRYFTLGIRFKH
jgi:iron complex outermembrane receptor protein